MAASHQENVADVVRAGCDWIVTGSSVFHSADPEAPFAEMRQIARERDRDHVRV